MRSVSIRGARPPELRELSTHLQHCSGAQYVLWFGRATTALFYLLARLRETWRHDSAPEVVLPSVCCAGLVNAILLAGCRPRFADVDPCTGLILESSVSARLSDATLAVIAIHLFGSTADCSALARVTRSRGILLIEDCAQIGLPSAKDQFGRWGDAVLYSFGSSKLFGMGSGAVAIHNPELGERLGSELDVTATFHPLEETALSAYAARYRDQQLAALKSSMDAGEAPSSATNWARQYDALYVRPYGGDARASQDWLEWPALAQRRLDKANVYADVLRGTDGVDLITGWQASGVCWRFSLLARDDYQARFVTESLRSRGFHASNLFWPLHTLFASDDACPGATSFGRRVINLWVDDSVDETYAQACAQNARELLSASGHVGKSPRRSAPKGGPTGKLHATKRAGRLYRGIAGVYGGFSRRVLPAGYALPPIHYFMEVTRRCNLRCGMCQFGEWLRATPGSDQSADELSTEEWKAIIDQTARFGLISFTGGEPWVRDDFRHILTHAAQKRRVHLISNGTRFTSDDAELVAKLAPAQLGRVGINAVGISIHGEPTIHDAITRRPGAYAKAIEAIRTMAELRAGRRTAFGPLLHVTCVLQRENLATLHTLPELVAAAGADVLNLTLESHQGDLPGFGARHPAEYEPGALRRPRAERPLLLHQLRQVRTECERVGLQLRLPHMPTRDVLDYYDTGMDVRTFVCRTGWLSMSVDAQGRVYPCFFLQVGNTREQSLAEIWNGQAMRAFRQTLGSRVYPACQGCCNLQYIGKEQTA